MTCPECRNKEESIEFKEEVLLYRKARDEGFEAGILVGFLSALAILGFVGCLFGIMHILAP